MGYYRLWIPNCGLKAQRFYEDLKGKSDSKSLLWGPNQTQAFQLLKTLLSQAPALGIPRTDTTFQLFMAEK